MIKTRLKRILWLFLMLFGVTLQYGAVHKIMFIGDSITYGKNCMPGFRDDVYWFLHNMGFPFEFVGSVNETPPFRGFYFDAAESPDFFKRYGEHNVASDMDLWQPTIVVIHLGTNDFWLNDWIEGGPYSNDGGQTFTDMVSGHLAQLVSFLTKWHDGRRGNSLKTIFLCQIIPKTWRHMGPTGIPMLNQDLEWMVEDIENGFVPAIPPGLVRLVDQFTDFTGDMFSDDKHPNCIGYYQMAKVFKEAFKTLPMYMQPMAGWDQRVLPGSPLPDPVVFSVTDGLGQPAPDVPVQFSVTFGDATILSQTIAVSDSQGKVAVRLSIGWSDSSVVQAYAPDLIDSISTCTLYPRDHLLMAGNIHYFWNDSPVSDVKIRWMETDRVTHSDTDGYFEFDGVALEASATLIPSRESENAGNAEISILNAAMIARHVTGIEPFTIEEQIAADINGDSVVNIQDAVTVARLVVGLESADSTAMGQWHFQPPSIYCDSLITDIDSLCFAAVRTGDFEFIENDFNTTNGCIAELGQENHLGKFSNTQSPVIYKPLWIYGESVMAGQFSVVWDTSEAELMDIQSHPGFHMSYHCLPNRGEARVALFSPNPENGPVQLFTLIFTAKRNSEPVNIRIQNAEVNGVTLPMTETGIAGALAGMTFEIEDNYPNPFNGTTLIPVSLSEQGHVRLKVFNVLGQEIRTLFQGFKQAGQYRMIWNGRDDAGQDVPSGIYFIVIESERNRFVKRMELIR